MHSGGDASVVDEDVDRSDPIERVAPSRGIGDVERRAPSAGQRRRHGRSLVGVDVVDDHLCALGRQCSGDPGADVAARPGHQGSLSIEAKHRRTVTCRPRMGRYRRASTKCRCGSPVEAAALVLAGR